MRKILIITLVLLAVAASNCGNGSRKNSGNSSLKTTMTGTVEIAFREYEHNFGKVAEGEKVGYTFTFDNRGTANLIIASVTTSCGCTVPKYNAKPIPPGNNGNIEVVFDTSGRNGMQTKTITVKSNASIPVVLLKITAEVVSTQNK
jgi:Tfp pilus assembly protein PilX